MGLKASVIEAKRPILSVFWLWEKIIVLIGDRDCLGKRKAALGEAGRGFFQRGRGQGRLKGGDFGKAWFRKSLSPTASSLQKLENQPVRVFFCHDADVGEGTIGIQMVFYEGFKAIFVAGVEGFSKVGDHAGMLREAAQ